MLNSPQSAAPHQLCPLWSATFHALQTEHTNLTAEAQNQVQEILASPLTTREKSAALEPITKTLESLAEKLESTFQKISYAAIHPEVLALNETLEKDYQAEIAKWQWYPKTRKEADGTITNLGPILQQDPETGKYFYTGDYDGTSEKGGKGENFTNQKFIMPTLAEAMRKMTAEQVKQYQEMIEAGEEPKLQLVPIALSIRTLGRAIDGRKAEIKINKEDTFVEDKIIDSELKYEPESFKASRDGKKLITKGGISKSEYIRKYQGWAVEIVATKPELTKEKSGTHAQQTTAFMKEAISAGYRGCSYESAISAHMLALQKTPPGMIDTSPFTVVPDSSLINEDCISAVYWDDDRWDGTRVYLGGWRVATNSFIQRHRFRRLIRLKKWNLN